MDSKLLSRRIGARIKARRAKLGMTQEELARPMGFSRASLANIETGRQNVLLHHLYDFAEALDLELSDLLPDPAEFRKDNKIGDLPFSEDLSRKHQAQIAPMLRDDSSSAALAKDEQHARRRNSRS